MTFVRFYCCHWRFSAPAVAPLKDRIVSAESNILNLKNQPIFNTFFRNQVDIRGLRCDITRKPFNSTLSKGKKNHNLSTRKDFTVSYPSTLADQRNWIKFLLSAIFPNREDFETSWCFVWRKPNASICQKSTEWERIQNHIPRGQRIKSNMFQLSARAF